MPEPTAATVLADLHVSHPVFLKNFASARYVVWAGSGVSYGRYPVLTEVVGRVLAFLWSKRTDIHHLDALERILKLVNAEAMLACEEPTDFPEYEKVVVALTDQYSRVFNEPVSGQDDPDYLLWVGADFPATFMAESEPNSEHLCLALLMREGVIESVVSTNWDCLIELSIQQLCPDWLSSVSVMVEASDLNDSNFDAAIYKMHGCAGRARVDEKRFRGYLVATQNQISGWMNNPVNAVMKGRLADLTTTKRSALFGFSAADTDVQQIFSAAAQSAPRNWPGDGPAVVFAEPHILPEQRDILAAMYSHQHTKLVSEIRAGSVFPMYSRPLLLALLIGSYSTKLSELAALIFSPSEVDSDEIDDDIRRFGQFMAALLAAGTPEDVRGFAAWISCFVETARRGKLSSGNYQPLTSNPVGKLSSDPNVIHGGMPQFGVLAALLGHLFAQPQYVGHPAPSGFAGVLVESESEQVLVAYAQSELQALQLRKAGIAAWVPGARVVLMCGATATPAQRRSPSSRLRPNRSSQLLEHGIDQLIARSPSIDDLRGGFRQAVLL